MNNYEILGVEKNASKEEIKLAYENKVKDIDRQVANKKNADAFKKVLSEAYEGIISNDSVISKNGQAIERTTEIPKEAIESEINQNLENTTVMSKTEIDELLDSDIDDEEDEYYSYEEDEDYPYYEEDYEHYNQARKSKKKARRKSSSSGATDKKKRRYDGNSTGRSRENSTDNGRDYKREHKKEVRGSSGVLLIPFKILAIPLIILLSIVLLILDLVSAAVWFVSKILFVVSVAMASIFGYLVYNGTMSMRYDIFVACGAGFIVSICLPLITKIFRAPLKGINNMLKDFVF